ncbi:hypothetical protein R83H12_00339 [Fibrobacteria bacterium R8-3-H12]
MKKLPLNALFLCLLATQALADYCNGGKFIEASGTGKNPSEASNMAIAEIGKRINVLVESQENTSVSSMERDGIFQESSSYAATSQIKSSAAIPFLQKIEERRLENGEYRFSGYVCHSDVAKPYLDSLNRYLTDSLEVFLKQELDEDICISAGRAKNKMQGWQRILESLNQASKNLQRKYMDASGRMEKDCGEIKKRQTIAVVATGTEPKGSNALKNLEKYVEEYLVNSALYSAVAGGGEAKFKCEVEIAQSYSSYTLRAKIVNASNGKIAHSRMANVESNLKTSVEHKEASLKLVSLLLKRCGTMSVGETYDGECKNGLRNGKGKLTYLSGDVYEGEFKNDHFDGKGKFIYQNGSVYEGEFKNGQPNGKGKAVYPDLFTYEGDWKNSKADGKGKAVYPNGLVYEGSFKNDKFEGKGKITYSNGNVYEGEFKNYQPDGKGKFTYANGSVYIGEWKNGLREGNGKYIYADGGVYEGLWKNDKIFEGKGKSIYEDGGVYVGEFKNGFREGKGKVTYPDGGVYVGDWKNDKFDGKGKAIYANGEVYEGEFKNNLREGKGKFTYANGDVYEGDFKNGLPNGRGKAVYADGMVHEGDWKNGEFLGEKPSYATNRPPADGKGKVIYPDDSVYPPIADDIDYGEYNSEYNGGYNGGYNDEYIEPIKTSKTVAKVLCVLGAAVIGYAVYENSEMNVAYEKYNRKGYSRAYYEDAWKDVDSYRKSRNMLYVIGSLVLSSGIGVHIWF